MCIAAWAWGLHHQFPFVLIANRDEFYARPTRPMQWWEPSSAGWLLAGQDLHSQGSWLALSETGRLALLTNIREPQLRRPIAPSRGQLVIDWVQSHAAIATFSAQHQLQAYNGFNLLALDFNAPQPYWYMSSQHRPQALPADLYGLSNAHLDTPWPKVKNLKTALAETLTYVDSADKLAHRLLQLLAHNETAADEQLPQTGVSRELEKAFSAIHIHIPDIDYGTRCSTVIITEAKQNALCTTVIERTFDPLTRSSEDRVFAIDNWPCAAPICKT